MELTNLNKIIRLNNIESLTMGEGTRESQILWVFERSFLCTKYHGKFDNPNLNGRASTGLWFCVPRSTFCGLVIEGEGNTPIEAFNDMRKRAAAEIERAKLIHYIS
jgi:hypothetical protein